MTAIRLVLSHRAVERSAARFVESIRLFGSRAWGDNGARADIDLAVACPGAMEDEWRRIPDSIENADTLLEIDCVRLDALDDSDSIKRNIMSQGKILYNRSG